MTVIELAKDMERAIRALSKEGDKAAGLIELKALAMAEYDKRLGMTIGAMKASGTAVTIIDKLAKGEVQSYLYKKIIAEESLKAHYSRMEQLKAQLNGLQSMNRYLDVRP